MREVRGRTLQQVLDEVHAASGASWEPSPSGWTLQRLMTAFLAVCNAVAHAHERGVVHRDLKPENVMLGDHGEVYVLDWGLAKVLGRRDRAAEAGELDLVHTDRSSSESASHHTRVGEVTGTPAYMPPEQARGEIDRIDARSDVYALGAMLYEVLSGRPPYEGHPRQVVAQVVAGPPAPVGRGELFQLSGDSWLDDLSGPPLPEALVQACNRAMARDPEDRYPSATALAEAVQGWLDGSRRREQALQVVEQSLAGVGEARRLREEARRLQAEGDEELAAVERWRPETAKAGAWAKQESAARLRLQAGLEEQAVEQGLQGALRIEPSLPEAHAALAARYRERHAEAEQARDADEVARVEQLVRHHVGTLPESHPTRTRCAAYLQGDGALTLVTDPPGARVRLFRHETRRRRLVEVFERELGETPLTRVSLAMGSYLCVLSHPECEEVRYPVHVRRQGHWDGRAPGEDEPTPIWLPPRGHLAPDEVYVPPGWFRAGGDPSADFSQAARPLWCDGFVVQRFPVTNTRYIEFLDDLVARGREEEALRHAPRERPGVGGEQGALIYRFDGTRFSLAEDADGHTWLPDWPVFLVDWFGAAAWAAWHAQRTGQPWRLPLELEWEKAARGVDGRFYPWGDHLDPSWCCMGDSHPGQRLPVAVDTFPVDVSVYGVRGLGGNVRDWCLDLFEPPVRPAGARPVEPPLEPDTHAARVSRGGYWSCTPRLARSTLRLRGLPTSRLSNLGFRACYRVEGPTPDR
jgi:serine/threonine-protein kinase